MNFLRYVISREAVLSLGPILRRNAFFCWCYVEVSKKSSFGIIYSNFKNFEACFSRSNSGPFFFLNTVLKSAPNFKFSGPKKIVLVNYVFALTYRMIYMFTPHFPVKWLWRMIKGEFVACLMRDHDRIGTDRCV